MGKLLCGLRGSDLLPFFNCFQRIPNLAGLFYLAEQTLYNSCGYGGASAPIDFSLVESGGLNLDLGLGYQLKAS